MDFLLNLVVLIVAAFSGLAVTILGGLNLTRTAQGDLWYPWWVAFGVAAFLLAISVLWGVKEARDVQVRQNQLLEAIDRSTRSISARDLELEIEVAEPISHRDDTSQLPEDTELDTLSVHVTFTSDGAEGSTNTTPGTAVGGVEFYDWDVSRSRSGGNRGSTARRYLTLRSNRARVSGEWNVKYVDDLFGKQLEISLPWQVARTAFNGDDPFRLVSQRATLTAKNHSWVAGIWSRAGTFCAARSLDIALFAPGEWHDQVVSYGELLETPDRLAEGEKLLEQLNRCRK